ncbi:hypothetical protein FC75_GL002280 [Lacticaseibacillus camelliae DSM 22697 = JCM 13995]|uniref:DUF2975 domain-containing protein n=2 Tax=Lacticaseibacillus camelliae TaxID=381742 RepID=A0A0R2F0W8_9LACO|nr:hypothetical protein FC75_GL002280 [Lacticaseibacillus camelliae DSM 22697 = JCM 13995]
MMKIRIWLLKLLLIASVIAIGAFGIGLIPSFPGVMVRDYQWPVAAWAFTLGAAVAVVSYWLAAFIAWHLLDCITANAAFTQRAVTLIIRLKWAVGAMALGLLVCLPQWYRMADHDDAPGVMVIGLGFFAIPAIVWLFLAILQQLWTTALAYKTENDMTV